jgi:site-specific recombinase XerD
MAENNPTNPALLDQFVAYCRLERGLAASTACSYKHSLARFLRWLLEKSARSVQRARARGI